MKQSKEQQSEPTPLPPVEEVAQAIVNIATGMKKMNSSRLKRDAVVILLQAQCGAHVNRSQIRMVLDSLDRMDRHWLKPLETKAATRSGGKGGGG
jgi:hypothetical protein